MNIGGQILWNVIPICETFKIYYLMGRCPMKDVLGNHLMDRSFRLVRWLRITLFLRVRSWEDKEFKETIKNARKKLETPILLLLCLAKL